MESVLIHSSDVSVLCMCVPESVCVYYVHPETFEHLVGELLCGCWELNLVLM